MNPTANYFLLRKNNSLQTIVPSIHPYVHSSKDKEETIRIKQKLELIYLRQFPIHFHFDHIVATCDEEIISFDQFLVTNYGFSFLSDGFNHRQKELRGQILYDKKFPVHLKEEELLLIQKRMSKYHFNLVEQEANGKAIILLNPWVIENPLRDGEIFKLQELFDSKKKAQYFIDRILEGQFDLDGTSLTVGPIRKNELTAKTMEILNSQCDIRYKPRQEDHGEKFVSSNNLSDILNGMEMLLGLFESVGKKPYKIIELN